MHSQHLNYVFKKGMKYEILQTPARKFPFLVVADVKMVGIQSFHLYISLLQHTTHKNRLMFCCISASRPPPQAWTAANAPALGLSATRLPPPGVSRQPAALHRLCRAGVHLSGKKARLRGPAHHHRRLLGALRDLGGERLGGGTCTVHAEECKWDYKGR